MSSVETDKAWMREALTEARKGIGLTSPNPTVGAVLVRDDRIVGAGYHHAAGKPHAEIEAIANCEGPVSDATLYITLEPCSTHGRTPPCVEAILNAGIKRVVVGAIDPNPNHAGRGLRWLEQKGISVTSGVLATECSRLNEAFNRWITTGLPLVIAKSGMSLDGRIERRPEVDRYITSAESRAHSHQLRAQVDAIMVGAETARADNPRLTVRGISGARQPWRVVVTRSGNLPKQSHLFTDEFANRTLVFANKPLASVLKALGDKQITSVLIEGGGTILGEAFDERLVDRVHWYIAPRLIGGGRMSVGGSGASSNETAPRVGEMEFEPIGDDLFCSGRIYYPQTP